MGSINTSCLDITYNFTNNPVDSSDIVIDIDFSEVVDAINALQEKLKQYPGQCMCDNDCGCDTNCVCHNQCTCNSQCSCVSYGSCSSNCPSYSSCGCDGDYGGGN